MIRDNRISRNSSIKELRLCAVAAVLLSTANGWAQREVETNFSPAEELSQVKLDSRSAPAKVTTEDDTALADKGYAQIGSVTAHQDRKKTSPEVTHALNAAALARAAGHGGDLVRFEREGTVCKECETASTATKMRQVGAESQGSVWRYDPDLNATTKRVLKQSAETQALDHAARRGKILDDILGEFTPLK